MITFPYPDANALQASQSPLRASPMEDFQFQIVRAVRGDKIQVDPNEARKTYFDVSARSDLHLGAFIFPFAFYLTKQRRTFYGVLPYGKQTGAVLIIRASDYEHIIQTDVSLRGIDSTQLLLNDVFVNDLVEFVVTGAISAASPVKPVKRAGQIYTLKGFFHDELISLISDKNCTRDNKKRIPEICSPIDPQNESAAQAIVRLFADKLGKDWEKNDKGEMNPSIALLDSIYADEARKMWENSGKVRVVNVKHDIEIPVGVGFNLVCLPQLLDGDKWKKILDVAGVLLAKGTPTRAYLEKIGVEVTI